MIQNDGLHDLLDWCQAMPTNHCSINKCPTCGIAPVFLDGEIRTYLRPFETIVPQKYGYCEACDFAFSVNPLTEDRLKLYYQKNDQYRRSTLTPEEANHISEQVRFCMDFKPLQVLEIGADSGTFLSILNQRTNAEVYFDELNMDAFRILQEQKIKPAVGGDTFDMIVLRHVFEHIPLPLHFLREIRGRLKKNGVLIIEVPDCTAIAYGRVDHFQFEHVNYFSLTSVQALARRSGFTIEKCEFARTPGYSTTPNRVMRLALRLQDTIYDDYNSTKHWQKLLDDTNEIYRKIDHVLTKSARIALYGAGAVTMGYMAFTSQKRPFVRVYDADPKKIGDTLFGIKVSSPDEINSEDFDHILLTVIGYEKEVRRFLLSKSIESKKILSIGDKHEEHV